MFLSPIVCMELVVTTACNMSCGYCFEHDAKKRVSISLSTAFSAVDFLMTQSQGIETVVLSFIGGEPLINFDVLRSAICYVKEHPLGKNKQVNLSVTTNGTLLNEDILQFFHDNDCRFLLSIDGDRADNDFYRKMQNGKSQFKILQKKKTLLKSYQPWQGAKVTVMPLTAKRIAENIYLLYRDFKINQFLIGFVTGVEWTDAQIAGYCIGLKEVFEFLLQERINSENPRLRISLMEVGLIDEAYAANVSVNWGCGAGSGRVSVWPDGTLYGCTKMAFAAKGREKPLPLGNVFEGFTEIKNRLTLLNHTETVRPKCKECELAKRCNGGCYAANLTDTGNIFTPSDTYCKLIFAQMDAAKYARNRLRELGLQNIYWPTGEHDAGPSGVS